MPDNRRWRRDARAEAAPPPIGVPARKAALRMLDAALRRGEALERAAHAATQGIGAREDRALAIAIAAETLRRLPDLDALIDSATSMILPPDAKARNVLRLALVQVLAMGTPAHAAIATALPLVDGGPRKLVHGVFSTLMRRNEVLPAIATLPADVAARWVAQWGEEILTSAGKAIALPPPLDVTLKDPASEPQWADRLVAKSMLRGQLRLSRGDAVASLPGYDEGAWWVQDAAASLPARLLGAGEGRQVLDLCAAPGGKTMQLAAAGWTVTAVDISARRLEILRENLKRTGLAAKTIVADIGAWSPEGQVDAILLDAPCSSTGTFRRHPEVLYRVGEPQIAELAELQAHLLRAAARWVKPGGRIVFATCSLERLEGEDVTDAFLAHHPAWIGDDGHETVEPALLELFTPERAGEIRILPDRLNPNGNDGFYMRLLRRMDG